MRRGPKCAARDYSLEALDSPCLAPLRYLARAIPRALGTRILRALIGAEVGAFYGVVCVDKPLFHAGLSHRRRTQYIVTDASASITLLLTEAVSIGPAQAISVDQTSILRAFTPHRRRFWSMRAISASRRSSWALTPGVVMLFGLPPEPSFLVKLSIFEAHLPLARR